MIRELTIAAAAAAVGYAVGQRASADTQSRFSQPEVTGDDAGGFVRPEDVEIDGKGVELSAEKRRRLREKTATQFDEEVIGR